MSLDRLPRSPWANCFVTISLRAPYRIARSPSRKCRAWSRPLLVAFTTSLSTVAGESLQCCLPAEAGMAPLVYQRASEGRGRIVLGHHQQSCP
jgi:hypothetical protein